MTGRWDNGSMFIDGAWTPDDTAIVGEVIDLATEVVIGSVPDADPKAAHAAIAAARRAFDDGPWPRMSPRQRGRRCCVGWRTSSMSATTRSRNW
ncbi:MAG: aldehyde dehydrogenase family protein [Mycobacterium sp.]